ncbi:hypothetical protein O5707_18655 [Escherichia coli]|nr:hypothetical protein [Escherichia coli]
MAKSSLARRRTSSTRAISFDRNAASKSVIHPADLFSLVTQRPRPQLFQFGFKGTVDEHIAPDKFSMRITASDSLQSAARSMLQDCD